MTASRLRFIAVLKWFKCFAMRLSASLKESVFRVAESSVGGIAQGDHTHVRSALRSPSPNAIQNPGNLTECTLKIAVSCVGRDHLGQLAKHSY